jgi:ABC-type multidrug transport system ATPase subunit
VRKDYGAVKALKGLDLGIFENEVFGLLEPNGAGKATLVKLLLGLIHPTGGDVSVRV